MGCDQNQVEVLKCLQNRDMADVMILSEVIEGTTKWMAVPDNDFTQGFIEYGLILPTIMSPFNYSKEIAASFPLLIDNDPGHSIRKIRLI